MWIRGLVAALALGACTKSALTYESQYVETPRSSVHFVIDTLGDREGVAQHLRLRERAPDPNTARVYELCSARTEQADGTWLEAGDCRCFAKPAVNDASSDSQCGALVHRVPVATPNCDLGARDPRQTLADAIEIDLAKRASGSDRAPSQRMRASEVTIAAIDGDDALTGAKNYLLWVLRDPTDPSAGQWLGEAITTWKRVLDVDAQNLGSGTRESPTTFVAAYDLALAWRLFGKPEPDVDCSKGPSRTHNLWRVYAAIALLQTPAHYQGYDVLRQLEAVDPGQLSNVSPDFPDDAPDAAPVAPPLSAPDRDASWTRQAPSPGERHTAAARRLAREIYLRRWQQGEIVAPLQAAARLAEDARFTEGPVPSAARWFYLLAAERATEAGVCRRMLALATPRDGCGPNGEGRPVSP